VDFLCAGLYFLDAEIVKNMCVADDSNGYGDRYCVDEFYCIFLTNTFGNGSFFFRSVDYNVLPNTIQEWQKYL